MRQFLLFSLFLIAVGSNYGCAAVMASKQPSEKNLSVFTPGTSRALVLVESGRPVSSEYANGKKTEIYKFTDGYSTGTKVVRVMFHIAADVFTLFLWEFIGMPIEIGFDGTEIAYKVQYDEEDKVTAAEMLKGEKSEIIIVAGDCDPGIDSCS